MTRKVYHFRKKKIEFKKTPEFKINAPVELLEPLRAGEVLSAPMRSGSCSVEPNSRTSTPVVKRD
jgi:hypothetical protein